MRGCHLTFAFPQLTRRDLRRDRSRQFPVARRFDTLWAMKGRSLSCLRRLFNGASTFGCGLLDVSPLVDCLAVADGHCAFVGSALAPNIGSRMAVVSQASMCRHSLAIFTCIPPTSLKADGRSCRLSLKEVMRETDAGLPRSPSSPLPTARITVAVYGNAHTT